MKKIVIITLAILSVACANQKVVQHNENRLNTIEEYLRQNKMIKPSAEFERLQKEGKIVYIEEHKSLEKEAEVWKEQQEK